MRYSAVDGERFEGGNVVIDERERLAKIMTPVAPPRLIDGVYTDDQYERILAVIKAGGPWPSITAHHFTSVEQLIATSTGIVPANHGLTLDDLATAHYRGFLAENSVCLHPQLEDVFYNSGFLAQAKSYWGAPYAKPTLMLFNICGAHQSGLNPHIDATTFRGIRIENSPVWLQNIMAKSGLFTDYLIKMAQIITWWYRGEAGTFTYWPDGPLRAPERLETPIWNSGVVVQNELMFHRGDPVGAPEDRVIPGLKHRSKFSYRANHDDWVITTDDDVIRTYHPDQIRLLVHWNAEIYQDLDELKKVMDHSDDLSHDQAFDVLLRDLRRRGVEVDTPTDPLNDDNFIRALLTTYTIKPEIDWLTP